MTHLSIRHMVEKCSKNRERKHHFWVSDRVIFKRIILSYSQNEVTYAVVDQLKLREALGELIRNSLSALPEVGGSLGIRSSLTTGANDATELLIEVADDGAGSEQPLINKAFLTFDDSSKQRLSVGLKLTKAIVEEHGGSLTINSKPNLGTHVQIQLPLRQE